MAHLTATITFSSWLPHCGRLHLQYFFPSGSETSLQKYLCNKCYKSSVRDEVQTWKTWYTCLYFILVCIVVTQNICNIVNIVHSTKAWKASSLLQSETSFVKSTEAARNVVKIFFRGVLACWFWVSLRDLRSSCARSLRVCRHVPARPPCAWVGSSSAALRA